VTSRQPLRSSSAADAARAQGRPERGRDGQYASRISLRQQVDGRAAVESCNPSGASARLCEDPPRSQVADRNFSTTGPARCGTPLPWIRTCDRPAMNFPCKSRIFSVARAGPVRLRARRVALSRAHRRRRVLVTIPPEPRGPPRRGRPRIQGRRSPMQDRPPRTPRRSARPTCRGASRSRSRPPSSPKEIDPRRARAAG
jgi:hypothetical protein